MKHLKCSYIFVTLIILCSVYVSQQVKVADDLRITRKQKQILDNFREKVKSRLTKEYQKDDVYLIRWLRARNFDLSRAEQMLMDDVKWREENKMDTILQEDWSDFEKEFPYAVDGYDNEGKPIMTANYDEWDIRGAVLAGKRDRLARWMTRALELATTRVRELQAEGKNVTQWDFIINMNSFNLVTHGCLQCLPVFLSFTTNYEYHYPLSADKLVLINTPGIFEVVLNLVRPVMSQQTRDALKVYGVNRDEWEPILFTDIKRDQLPKTYGGTKASNS